VYGRGAKKQCEHGTFLSAREKKEAKKSKKEH
jgi:hypothetical protein